MLIDFFRVIVSEANAVFSPKDYLKFFIRLSFFSTTTSKTSFFLCLKTIFFRRRRRRSFFFGG